MSFRPPHLERYPLQPPFVIVGDWPIPAKSNLVGGHEGAGIVVAVGSNVHDMKIGDHVGTKVSSPLYGVNGSGCTIRVGNVSIVWMTRKHIVLKLNSRGILSTEHFSNTRYVNPITSFRSPNPSIWPPQPQLSAPEQPHTESPLSPPELTHKQALQESSAKPNQWVAIPGAGGGLGHLAIQLAKSLGLKVLAIGTGPLKAHLAKSLGADIWLDYRVISGDAEIEEVRRVTGGGAHAFIVLADHVVPYRNAMRMVRTRGTIVCVGMPVEGEIREAEGGLKGLE